MLSILLLGPPHIQRDNQTLVLTRRQSRALVYYLATQSAPLSREHIWTFFWPDHERTAAQQTLRTTLHGIRKVLGAALLADNTQIALGPYVTIDVQQLAKTQPATTDPEQLAAALQHYRGDFLSGFSLPNHQMFDDWAMAERERYRELALRGFTTLAHHYEQQRDIVAALATIRRAVELDPLHEEAQRTHMYLHYLAGDRVSAIRRYEALRDLLDAELGVPPMPKTQALYDAIVTDTLTDQRPATLPTSIHRPAMSPTFVSIASPTLPFVGRGAELQRITVATAQQRLTLLEGEAGIGKTRLAEEFLRSFSGVALVSAARELEQSLPYQPIIIALRGLLAYSQWHTIQPQLAVAPVWLREVQRLLPELGSAPEPPPLAPATDESRLWEGVRQLLHAVAQRIPLVLVLDDLQWADRATLGLLGYVVRQTDATTLRFVATSRPVAPRTPLATLLQTLRREQRLELIALEGLPPTATLELAQHLSPTYAYPLADWLEASAEGNPYMLAEMMRYARDHGLITIDGTLNLSALSTPVLPQSIYSLIRDRLDQRSAAARRLIDAAVAAGREFAFAVVAQAADIPEAAALDALDELRTAGLIQPLDDGLHYRFDHTLTMEVAYREIGEPRHQLMHRRIAEVLASRHHSESGTVAGLIMSHFVEGNAPEQALPYALQAGRRAAGLAAWKEAVGFYEQALRGAPANEHAPVLLLLSDACYHAGEAPQATTYARRALAFTEHTADGNAARLALARSLMPQAQYAEALDLVRQVRNTGTPVEQITAEFSWGTALSLEGADLGGASAHLRQAEHLLDSTTHEDRGTILAQIRFELGSVAAQQGDLERAVAYYHEALAAAEQAHSEQAYQWRMLAHNNIAYHLHLLGDPAAHHHIVTSMQIAEERGLLGFLPYLYSTSGEIALAAGDIATAEHDFGMGLRLAEQIANPERIAGLTANLGLVALRHGDNALARQRLSDAMQRADALGTRHLAAQIRVWLARLLPRDEAQQCLSEARAIAESGGRQRLLAEIESQELRTAKTTENS